MLEIFRGDHPMTCNNIILSQPESGAILSHEIPSDVSARLNFGSDNISGLRVGDEGQLVINFVEGGQLNITNFEEVVANGNLLYLEDGTLIDPTILTGALRSPQDFNNIETAAGAATNADAIRIAQPEANTTQEVNMQAGQKYICDFDPANAATVEIKDGAMILTFADGSQVVINNYEQAMAGDLPAELTVADGAVVDTENLITEATEVESVEEILQVAQTEEEVVERSSAETVANIEPAAGDAAEALALIEPAAGEEGGVSNSGYGFGSVPASAPLDSPDAIGPLGPTQLVYQAPEFLQETLLMEETPFDPSPRLSASSLTLDETNLTAGGGMINGGGTVTVNYGGDGPGIIAPNGNFSATCNLTGNQLSSGGVPVIVTPTLDGYEGFAGATLVFTFTIDPETGDYTYVQNEPFDHSDTNDDNEEICLDFGIVVTDADQDSTNTNVRVNILDDAPVVFSQPAAVVDETNLDGGDLVVNGVFAADAGEDDASVTYTGNNAGFSAGGSLDNNALTSHGVPVIVTYDAGTNTYTGDAGGTTVFTFVVDPATGAYTYTQIEPLDHADDTDPDDDLTLNFDVTITDFDGDSETGQITVRVFDDGPEAKSTTNSVDETDLNGGVLAVNGSVVPDFGEDGPAVTDAVDANGDFQSSGSKLAGALTQNGVPVIVGFDANTNTYTGMAGATTVFTMVINVDGTYNFTLEGPLDHNDPNDPNDIINLDFGYSATDFEGDSAESFVRIQVKDDVPTINGSTGDVDETNFDLGDLTYSDTITTTLGADIATVQTDGIFTGAPTSNGVPVIVTNTPTGYEGTVSGATAFTLVLNPVTGQYTYTQFIELDHPDSTDPDDIISLGFGVEVTANDGTTDSATITIDVADDGPIANDDVNGAEEGQTITGDVVANDELSEDNPNTVTQVEFGGNTFIIPNGGSVPVPTPLGTLTLSSDGTYEFTATDIGDPDGTVTFTYTLVDNDDDSDTAELSIRVTPDGEPVAVTEEMTVDETNLQPGPLVINETLNVDFGLDGPGTITPNGSLTFGGSLANNALTSNDVPVVVTPTANGYVGVLQGTTTKVFELIIQNNGDYSFELFGPLDHADNTDPNDLIRLDFGITVADSDGDTANGNVRINVLDDALVAFDDVNNYDTAQGGATGNVITGLNGGPGAADILSEDNGATETSDNDVVEVSFNGNVVIIPAGGSNTIEGDFGILEMFDNGEYTYTLKPGVGTGSTMNLLDPTPADIAGTQSTITKNGITVTSVNGGDLTFTDDGIGISTGGNHPRVFGNNEALDVDFASASQVILTMGDLGNNPGSAMDFTVYLSDGTTRSIEVPVASIPQVNSAGSVTFDASTFGPGLTITGVDVFSHSTNSNFSKTSFSLVEVKTTHPGTDTVWDTFGYVLQDGDGDRDTATLMLCGEDLTDYHPIDIRGVGETDDTNLEFGPDVENGVINVNYQGDGPGTTTGNGDFDSSGNRTGNVLSSNGTPVTVDFNAITNTYTGTAGPITVFTMVINANGTYIFTQLEQLDHSDTTNDNESLFLDFGVTATDSDGDAGTGTVRITVLDDGPEIGKIAKPTDETDLPNGDLVLTGTVPHDFGEDGAGAISANGLFVAKFQANGPNVTLQSGGHDVTVTNTANVYTGKANGIVVFTLEVDPATGDYTYTQKEPLDHPDETNPDDVIWLKFYVDITDFDGDKDTGVIVVDVHDDGPKAVNDSKSVDEGETVTGNVITNDKVGADEPGTITQVMFNGATTPVPAVGTTDVIGQFGTLTIAANGSYSYTANNNDPNGIDQFKYTLRDFDGDTDTAILSIDVDPSNNPIDIRGVGETDDTNLEFGPDVENGVINVNYQGDGPGTTTGNGAFDSSGNRTANVLSSGGVPINVAFNAITNTYTGTAGPTTVFTMVINANGTYTFTQLEQLDHSDTTSNNEALFLDFGVTATDSDNDTGTGTVRITVLDDGPSAVFTNNEILHESDLDSGPLVATGTMDFDFGEDGAGTITPSGLVAPKYELGGPTVNITSGGQPVVFTTTANGYVGKVGSEVILTLEVHPTTGEYTYTQYEAVDHPEGVPGDDVMWINFNMTVTDDDGDSVNTIINIDLHDDEPVANDDKAYVVCDTKVESFCLDPTHYDVCDYETTLTRDGITISSNNGQDLTWVSNSDGSGVGIAGNGSPKIYGSNERLEVSFASTVTAAIFTLADMGANNIGDDFDYKVFLADGSSVDETITIEASMVTNGMIEFEVEGYGQGITGVDLIGGPSFVLNNVKAENVEISGGDVEGNVLTNDDIGEDDPGSVISVEFGGQTYDVPANGERIINGDNGTLTIKSNGQYSYVSNGGTASQKIYNFSVDNPSGSDKAGDIKNVSTSYNETTKDFTFSMTVESVADAIRFAVNDGPNPKDHPGELAFFYVDGTGSEPVVTVYGYNGVSGNSWKDGGEASGNQPADKILSSITNPELFSDISVTLDGNGNKIFSISLDVTAIQNHDPVYGPDGIWEGVEFSDKVGIWAHPLSGVNSEYGQDGFLTTLDYYKAGWYDTSNKPTEITIINGEKGDDTFTYTIRDFDGDTSTATLEICAKDFHNVIDVYGSGDFYGTADSDLFLFDAIGASAATLRDFNLGEDAVDLSKVLQGYDPLTDAINDFVYVTQSGGDTVISVDTDGNGGVAPREIAELDGITGQSLQDLVENGNIIV